MKKSVFVGSVYSVIGSGLRGVTGAALAGILCLAGPAIDKTFADGKKGIFKRKALPGTSSFPGERKSFPGTGSFPNERPAISFNVPDKELLGNMDKYLARKARVNKYLAWKASVNEYLAWKARVNEYLAWKADVNDYLAWKDDVNEYLAWKENVNEYLAWKASVAQQDMNSKASSASDQQGSGAGFIMDTSFVRGDVNQDGQVGSHDAVVILKWLVGGGPKPSCAESADVNNDGRVEINDAIQLLNYANQGMVPPAKPFPACGVDPDKGGNLGCQSYDVCASQDSRESGK